MENNANVIANGITTHLDWFVHFKVCIGSSRDTDLMTPAVCICMCPRTRSKKEEKECKGGEEETQGEKD